MKNILQYDTADGEPLYVEINDASYSNSSIRGLGEKDIIHNVNQRFENAIKPLKKISATIINSVKEISNCPQEIEVELSLKFSAKAGIILTSIDSEAHLRVTFKWTNIT